MNNRQEGFTLIEVMVAIMLMAIVSLIAWRGLDSVSCARCINWNEISPCAPASNCANHC
jgi:prepilin-type N-terminal cleavage/methylation domain-containing protein